MKLKSYQIALLLLVLLAWTNVASAGECIVKNSDVSASTGGTLPYLLDQIWQNGSCKVDSLKMRQRYSDFIRNDGPFHVIKFDKSMDIYADSLPVLHGGSGMPLVIVADSDATVRILGSLEGGSEGLIIRGGNGSIVIDNISIEGFAGTGVKMDSDSNLLIDVNVRDNGLGNGGRDGVHIIGDSNSVVSSVITGSGRDGIVIGSKRQCGDLNPNNGNGDNTSIIDSIIKNSGKVAKGEREGFGIYVNANTVEVSSNNSESRLEGNRLSGIYVESDGKACDMTNAKPKSVMLSKTTFGNNGDYKGLGRSLVIAGHPIPAPTGVANVSEPAELFAKIVGKYIHKEDSLWLINPAQMKFDIYRTDGAGEPGQYIATAKGVNATNSEFIITIEDTKGDARGALTAIAVDTENWQTSMLAKKSVTVEDILSPGENDADGDGLLDADEAGLKTDPFNPDSDGDGLTDGEEVHRIGLLKKLSEEGMSVGFPSILDPKNPDSDGDCLPDGLEMGITLDRLNVLRKSNNEKRQLALNPRCTLFLKQNKILDMKNAIWIDEYNLHNLDNVVALYDLNPATITDPTLSDTDGDGLSDGFEDVNLSGSRDEEKVGGAMISVETDPLRKDSDGDGIIDGDEGDVNGNGLVDSFESSPLLADTDDDGLSDSDEKRKGTLANSCDSDDDGLPDGIESGVIHPFSENSKCRGLQTAGSNFSNVDVLNPSKKDSDADGISDGEEDKNANGWLDSGETDPTTVDSDGDGISDYIEMTGDIDGDGVVDIDPYIISNGPDCSPPPAFFDADCDAVPNAVDTDSDNDGCLDRDESILNDANMNGVPDPFDSQTATCGAGSSSGGGSGSVGSVPTGDSSGDDSANSGMKVNASVGNPTGGGSCSLVQNPIDPDYAPIWAFIVLLAGALIMRRKKVSIL